MVKFESVRRRERLSSIIHSVTSILIKFGSAKHLYIEHSPENSYHGGKDVYSAVYISKPMRTGWRHTGENSYYNPDSRGIRSRGCWQTLL